MRGGSWAIAKPAQEATTIVRGTARAPSTSELTR